MQLINFLFSQFITFFLMWFRMCFYVSNENNLYVLLNFWLCVLFLVLKIVRDNPVVRFAARFKLLSFVYCWDTYFTFFSQWECETTKQSRVCAGLAVHNRTRRGNELHWFSRVPCALTIPRSECFWLRQRSSSNDDDDEAAAAACRRK